MHLFRFRFCFYQVDECLRCAKLDSVSHDATVLRVCDVRRQIKFERSVEGFLAISVGAIVISDAAVLMCRTSKLSSSEGLFG